jgi:glucose/arabinose dehydrogenase
VQIESAPGDPDRLFIAQQTGAVRVVDQGQLVAAPFIDVGASIIAGGEEGLLGLAFHPGYASNGRFFLHYTRTPDEASTVTEYAVGPSPLVANATPIRTVLVEPTMENNHNGGAIELGPDGFLYVALGDGGAAGDPGCDAMSPTNLLGKIARLDVDAPCDLVSGCPAAPTNPAGAKYFHVGLRNPWRITFDPCTGDLFIGDVGEASYEEIDVAPAAAGALNFGWPVREGAHPFAGYDGTCASAPPTFAEPIAEYAHTDGCAVTGGYVYRGSAIPALRGAYLYGDLCTGSIMMLRYANGVVTGAPTFTGLTAGSVTAFGRDGHGEVYVADYAGAVYRIDPD